MPVRKSADSLKVVCLQNVARNFQLWCKLGSEVSSQYEGWDYSVDPGPFIELPASLIEDLIEALKRVKWLRRHHLHYLLQPGLLRLDFSYDIGDIFFAMQFMVERCHKICHLDISFQMQLSPMHLSEALEDLPCLQVLNLKKTMCYDGTLTVLGQNCSNLISLNITFCNVSDRGIQNLCMDPDSHRPLCQKLARILLAETNVTRDGIALALLLLPNLQDLDYSNLLGIFNHANPRLMTRQFSISNLRSLGHATPESLDLALGLCPNLQKVWLLQVDLTDEDVLLLSNVNRLVELSVGNGAQSSVTFVGGILPLLQISGARLKTLSLNQMVSVNVAAIDQCCPSLQHLTLIDISHFDYDTKDNRALFLNLLSLQVTSTDEYAVNSSVLKLLLSSCSLLEQLRLKRCAYLEDVLMDEVLGINPLSNLVRMELKECGFITIAFLHELLLLDNNLQSLRVWSCKSIAQGEYEQLMTEAQNRNFDMYFDWL